MGSHKAYAVVACDGYGQGAVLWHLGLYHEIDEPGVYALSDLGLDDACQGISIWVGRAVWTKSPSTPDHPEEWDYELLGDYRDPTDEEWDAIRKGNNPFEPLRCKALDEDGHTVLTRDGLESETWDVVCESAAEHDGLCEKHYFQTHPEEKPGLFTKIKGS